MKNYTPPSLRIHEITPLSENDCFYIVDRHKTEFTYPLHSHEEFELNFVCNAAGVKRIVGDSIEIIGSYDLVLIAGKDLEHVWEQHECVSQDIREITIQFSANLFASEFFNKNQFKSINKMLQEAQKGLSFPLKAIMNVADRLEKLSSEQNGFDAVLMFLKILHELSLFADETKTLSSSSFVKIDVRSDSRRVQKVQEYINAHYKEEIRLNTLADLVNMNPAAFSRFFKLRTGKILVDYIIDIRLGHAARLLVNSTMYISEICYKCGFNNISNFNRLFRMRKHLSPKEFRKHYRKKTLVV